MQLLQAEPNLDAVFVTADAATRLEPIRAVCDHGLALFCEKPPALDLSTAQEISHLIQHAGIINSVGFQYRWSAAATRMRELISARSPLFARMVVAWPVFDWVRDGKAPTRLYDKSVCGGPIIEQAIHYQDVLRYITSDEPVHVHAMAAIGRTQPIEGRDSEETTILTAHHASGMLSTHVHNWSHTEALLQLQLVGNEFDLTWHIHEGEHITGRLDGEDVDERYETDCYVEEIRGFVAAVASDDRTLIRSTYADASQTLAVCEAAAHAVETGQGHKVKRIA
jgi:predicted dehydrogenase